jgi:hypothetical protein
MIQSSLIAVLDPQRTWHKSTGIERQSCTTPCNTGRSWRKTTRKSNLRHFIQHHHAATSINRQQQKHLGLFSFLLLYACRQLLARVSSKISFTFPSSNMGSTATRTLVLLGALLQFSIHDSSSVLVAAETSENKEAAYSNLLSSRQQLRGGGGGEASLTLPRPPPVKSVPSSWMSRIPMATVSSIGRSTWDLYSS